MADNTNAQDPLIVTRSERKRSYNAAYRAAHLEQEQVRRAAWKAANLDKVRAAQAAWRAANPERKRAYAAAYYLAHRDQLRAACASYHLTNREKICAAAVTRYAANRETIRTKQTAYQATNLEKWRATKATRRARKRQAGGKHSGADIISLLKLQRGKCAQPWCRKHLGSSYHVDHVMPLFLGGSNGRHNLQLLCPPCNLTKGRKHPAGVALSRGFLV